jgi:hypothetical protein
MIPTVVCSLRETPWDRLTTADAAVATAACRAVFKKRRRVILIFVDDEFN